MLLFLNTVYDFSYGSNFAFLQLLCKLLLPLLIPSPHMI